MSESSSIICSLPSSKVYADEILIILNFAKLDYAYSLYIIFNEVYIFWQKKSFLGHKVKNTSFK